MAELTQDALDAVVERAMKRLSKMAPDYTILVPDMIPIEIALSEVTATGWCEIGTIRDSRNRFWYRVLWHLERDEGRLLREKPKAKRDALGMCLPSTLDEDD